MLATAMREKVKSQTSDLSKNAENGLGLTWVCVEVKFGGLFMGFSSEERGEEEEKVIGEEREREVCFDVGC